MMVGYRVQVEESAFVKNRGIFTIDESESDYGLRLKYILILEEIRNFLFVSLLLIMY